MRNVEQRTLWDRSPGPPSDRHEAGIAASDLAAAYRWTPDELRAVDRAIEICAQGYDRFTADHIWRLLGDDFPVTKGLAGRLMAARNRRLIVGTGEIAFSQREGAHGHGQRLAIWKSLIR